MTSGGGINVTGHIALAPYAVYAFGDYGGTGAKYFIEPHPTDASKVIRYVALEGPESGTYFRGTAHASHGQAVIAVPEDFRMVTDDEGLSLDEDGVQGPRTTQGIKRFQQGNYPDVPAEQAPLLAQSGKSICTNHYCHCRLLETYQQQ